jgi:hypothetical protein
MVYLGQIISEGYQPTHQFISFVEGSSSEAPDPSSYPLQVLGADHNLNFIDGGDPTEGFAPWVTDILVYPSSEYWETQLDGEKVRPYFDLSISSYNTLRIPSAVHNYNLYVDDATVYGDLNIHGNTNLSGDISVTGAINPTEITVGNTQIDQDGVVADTLRGVSKTLAPTEDVTSSFVFNPNQTGTIFQAKGSSLNLNITLPQIATNGTIFTVMNCDAGKTVTIAGILRARGNVIAEQYGTATVYYANGWYAFGDLS